MKIELIEFDHGTRVNAANVTLSPNGERGMIQFKQPIKAITLADLRKLVNSIELAAMPDTEPEIGVLTAAPVKASSEIATKPSLKEFYLNIVRGGGGVSGMLSRLKAEIDKERHTMSKDEKALADRSLNNIKELITKK